MYEPVRATQQAAANVAIDSSGDESDDDTHNVGLNERLRYTSWCLCTKCEHSRLPQNVYVVMKCIVCPANFVILPASQSTYHSGSCV